MARGRAGLAKRDRRWSGIGYNCSWGRRTYDIEELRARAAMLDLLETDISLMHQGLNRLIRELLVRDRL